MIRTKTYDPKGTAMKYCVDCKWFSRPEEYGHVVKPEFGSCDNPRNIIESGISPELRDHRCKYAEVQRKYRTTFIRKFAPIWWAKYRVGDEMCGPDGDWWEPKP